MKRRVIGLSPGVGMARRENRNCTLPLAEQKKFGLMSSGLTTHPLPPTLPRRFRKT
jgi:hypothetical protein